MTDYGTPSSYGSETSTESSSPSATERARGVAESAAHEAGGVTGTAVDQTKAVASTAADQTRMVAHDAKDQARRLTYEAKTQLRRQVDDQASRFGRNLGDVGQQLRTMAEKADDPESPVTGITRQAADAVERLASRLEGGDLDQVVDDVKRFARNRPGVFLLGAAGLGFIVGRLFKAVDIGEVVKGSNGSDDRAATPWDDRDLELPVVASTDVGYESFATSPATTGYESGLTTTTSPEYPTTSTPSSVPTYSDPQATGYPSTPPVAAPDDEWGRT